MKKKHKFFDQLADSWEGQSFPPETRKRVAELADTFGIKKGARELDLLMHRAQIEIVAMNADQTELARAAWRKYGKGNHPAGLNIGDCCAYALAKYSGESLLFKGIDFSQTDMRAAITV